MECTDQTLKNDTLMVCLSPGLFTHSVCSQFASSGGEREQPGQEEVEYDRFFLNMSIGVIAYWIGRTGMSSFRRIPTQLTKPDALKKFTRRTLRV